MISNEKHHEIHVRMAEVAKAVVKADFNDDVKNVLDFSFSFLHEVTDYTKMMLDEKNRETFANIVSVVEDTMMNRAIKIGAEQRGDDRRIV